MCFEFLTTLAPHCILYKIKKHNRPIGPTELLLINYCSISLPLCHQSGTNLIPFRYQPRSNRVAAHDVPSQLRSMCSQNRADRKQLCPMKSCSLCPLLNHGSLKSRTCADFKDYGSAFSKQNQKNVSIFEMLKIWYYALLQAQPLVSSVLILIPALGN